MSLELLLVVITVLIPVALISRYSAIKLLLKALFVYVITMGWFLFIGLIQATKRKRKYQTTGEGFDPKYSYPRDSENT